jgi:pyruvate dehydrogenase E1 component alpha subunit
MAPRREAMAQPVPEGTTFHQEHDLTRYDHSELARMLRTMLLIRHFEERSAEMYTRARIGGYLHLNVGEEASVVGMIFPLDRKDYIFTAYREHGHAIARGVPAGAVMAELFGREGGTSRGRGGSMHLYDASRNFMGGYGIVGGMIPLAVGTALASEYRQTDEVTLCQFGDGSVNIGAFHESLNMAKVWRLPVVFACVNNKYGMGTDIERASAVTEVARRACAYDMASERIDGMDVLACYEATNRALERARKEREPTLLEFVTYRFRGHSMADPGRYRSSDEVQKWRDRDPIALFAARLREADLIGPDEYSRLDEEAIAEVEEAVQFAEDSPDPRPEDLEKYVYAPQEGL